MSGGFPFCCDSVGNTNNDPHTIVNVGGFAESYVIGTGPNPFELRTLQSSDGTVTITQNADDIDFQVPAPEVHTIENIGGFAESYVIGTGPNPFELRTLQSSDGTVTITQNADNIDFAVPPVVLPPEAWQVDTSTLIDTDSNTFVTFITMSGDAKVKEDEVWQINMGVLICCPYATAGTGVNAETQWQIEGPAGVFTQIDLYSVDEHITIVGSERSSPHFRMIKHTALMDAPRMRVRVRRTVVGFTDFRWEDARWGGNRISAA
jgi:hypothetical protein